MLEPSQPVTTIPEVAQYISEPMFGLKKVKLELAGHFDRKAAALNT